MTVRKGLGQANILRTNNNTSTGYGIVYADEVSGHRTVANLTALYALHDWQLSASGNNTDNDAIGQLWYVVDAEFQFHKGTIRTSKIIKTKLKNIYFNSIKVRLEQDDDCVIERAN